MTNEEKDNILDEVLLHKSKTSAYMKRLKKRKPKDWLRAYGNIMFAEMELNENSEYNKLINKKS